MELGYTLEYINEMEWPDVESFLKHWVTHPPLRQMVQSALEGIFKIKYGPKEPLPPPAPIKRPAAPAEKFVEPAGKSFDNLPTSVQDFLLKVKTGKVN